MTRTGASERNHLIVSAHVYDRKMTPPMARFLVDNASRFARLVSFFGPGYPWCSHKMAVSMIPHDAMSILLGVTRKTRKLDATTERWQSSRKQAYYLEI
jgi:hypothetical protein